MSRTSLYSSPPPPPLNVFHRSQSFLFHLSFFKVDASTLTCVKFHRVACYTFYSPFFSSPPIPSTSLEKESNQRRFICSICRNGPSFHCRKSVPCRPRFLSISNHVRYRAGKDPSIAAATTAASNGPRPCSVRCLSNPGLWSSSLLRSSRAY